MQKWPKLKFPPITPRARKSCGEIEVWDALRGRWLKLTPEEWVRRHLLEWLLREGVPPMQIIQEYPVLLNGQPQRADVVVVDAEAKPLLLVECKAAEVELSQSVLDQLIRYNSVVGARYLMITNGRVHHCYAFDGERTAPMSRVPDLKALCEEVL